MPLNANNFDRGRLGVLLQGPRHVITAEADFVNKHLDNIDFSMDPRFNRMFLAIIKNSADPLSTQVSLHESSKTQWLEYVTNPLYKDVDEM